MMCRLAADSTSLVDKQHPGYSTKLQTLDDLFGQLFAETDRKVLLFSEWTSMLDLIEPLAKKRGVEFVRLDGDVPQKQRAALVQRFQSESECRLFLTTNAGSTGLNLQAANTVINVDLPWNPAVLEQRTARAHRMGQTNPVQVYILITEGTIEESLLATLSVKRDLALAALDADSDVDLIKLPRSSDDLKKRLELLLGAKPNASVDESQRRARGGEAGALSAREQLAQSGGALVGAAVSFLTQLLPAPASEPDPAVEALTRSVVERLRSCVDRDESGRPRLTLTLPSDDVLEKLAGALAGILSPPRRE